MSNAATSLGYGPWLKAAKTLALTIGLPLLCGWVIMTILGNMGGPDQRPGILLAGILLSVVGLVAVPGAVATLVIYRCRTFFGRGAQHQKWPAVVTVSVLVVWALNALSSLFGTWLY